MESLKPGTLVQIKPEAWPEYKTDFVVRHWVDYSTRGQRDVRLFELRGQLGEILVHEISNICVVRTLYSNMEIYIELCNLNVV